MKKLQTLAPLVAAVVIGGLIQPAGASESRILDLLRDKHEKLLAEQVARTPQPEAEIAANPPIVHPDDVYVLPPIVETPVVTVPPEQIPVPEQIGWSWDRASLTVTNHEVTPSIQVLAYHGPYQRPLMPVAYLTPGQSVTILPPACGELMVVAVNGSVVEPDFAVC